MKDKSTRFAPLARRARTIAVGLAIAALSAGFAACGDDEQDEANQAVDDLQENVESALDEVDTEEAQQQAEEAQEQIESAAEEAQKEFEGVYGGGN